MFTKAQPDDPFLRTTDNILHTPGGLHPFDWLLSQPGKSLIRMYEYIDDRKQTNLPKHRNQVLTKGAAVGRGPDNAVVHFFPGRGLRFVGFLEGQSIDRAGVWVRGSVVLRIDGVTDKDRGRPIYCSGPDTFSLEAKRGAVEIGKVRYAEGENKAAVFFRSEGDVTPCYLHVN